MDKIADTRPLIVAENEIQDNARKIARLDPDVMGQMNVSDGDLIEVISQSSVELFTALALIPTDTSSGVIRLDRGARDILGTGIGDTIFVKRAEYRNSTALEGSKINSPPSTGAEEHSVESRATLLISGSCIDFENERHKIMDFIGSLEIGTDMKSLCRCYSDGKKTLGWDFFEISIASDFVEKLRNLYTDIDKQEGNVTEQRFVLWLDKHMKKKKLQYHLKLREIPFEASKGFRLNPKNYRDDSELEELR